MYAVIFWRVRLSCFSLLSGKKGIYTLFFDFFVVIFLFWSYHLSHNNLFDFLVFLMQSFINYFHIFQLAHSSSPNKRWRDMTYSDVFYHRQNTSLGFGLCLVILYFHVCRHSLGGQNCWLSMQRSFCLYILLIWIQHLRHSHKTPGTASHFSSCWIMPSEMTVRS